MAFKSDFIPLADTDLVDDDERARLRAVGIASVEELADAIAASPDSIAHVLLRSLTSVQSLLDHALGMLDEPARQAFAEPRTKYATGALPPRSRSELSSARRALRKHRSH